MTDADAKVTWGTEGVRATAFAVGGALLESRWAALKTIIKCDPAEVAARPTEKVTHEAAPYEGGRLVGVSQPGRFDWMLTPTLPTQGPPPTLIVTLGELALTVQKFAPVVNAWLDFEQPIQRLAFGCILSWPMNPTDEARRALQSLLPSVSLENLKLSDFFFQVNRPRPSRVLGELEINRLSKWQIQILQIQNIAPSVSGALSVSTANTATYARLEIDANTSTEHAKAIPSGALKMIFKELVAAAEELAVKGDIP